MAKIRVKGRDKPILQSLRKFEVQGEPDKHYVWVNPQLGPPDEDYEPVRWDEVKKGVVKLSLPHSAVDKEGSDIVEREGVQLYKIPQKLYDEKEAEMLEYLRKRTENIERVEITEVETGKVITIEDNTTSKGGV